MRIGNKKKDKAPATMVRIVCADHISQPTAWEGSFGSPKRARVSSIAIGYAIKPPLVVATVKEPVTKEVSTAPIEAFLVSSIAKNTT